MERTTNAKDVNRIDTVIVLSKLFKKEQKMNIRSINNATTKPIVVRKESMKKLYSVRLLMAIFTAFIFLFQLSCSQTNKSNLKEIAREAFIYAYPMMEQVKTVNGMMNFMGLRFNAVAMNPKLPWDNVGQPIVAPNLTSMTGGVAIDLSNGPVILEIPEVKDRYIVYQCVDVFTHNFFYMGTRANNGEGGRFAFYTEGQVVTDPNVKPVKVEGNHVIIINRIDITTADELDRVREIQNSIHLIDPPKSKLNYPSYNEENAKSPKFVEYLNTLLSKPPESEIELFKRFAKIGILSKVSLTDKEKTEVQAGIDAGFEEIKLGSNSLLIGNGYIGATEVFGTRQFLKGNYIGRATGAHFGLWGNSKEEANYFLSTVEGEGQIVFLKDEFPPLSDIGFWSITAHDENMYVHKNEYDSYVLTTDKMVFEDDGSIIFNFSSKPEAGNWLYTPGKKMGIVIRVYQADPKKIGSYIPPPFVPVK